VAFHDLHPKAKVHVLVVPRKHIHSLAEAGDDDTELLGQLLQGIRKAGEVTGVAEKGYRTIINTRQHGGQEIDHLHVHLLGGEPLGPMRA
jgi:histidine triad (HIT) family protein